MSKFTTKRLLYFFLRGLLILVPIALTVYIIVVTLAWIDSLVPAEIPGLGLLIVASLITLIGYLASTFMAKPIFELVEELIMEVPLISMIYSSIKDLLAAFVGDKKKFNQPVIVEMQEGSQLYKVGFMTQDDMRIMGHADKVAVYLPHSYNFSGNLYIVPRERVSLLHLPSGDVMKFVVSGGVSGYQELLLAEEHARNQEAALKDEPQNSPMSSPLAP
ncbi:DUF502 domain-containing protein [Cesiribacter andamanensis]|uniref:DUF502 domain-containing protein n=1 Tax=Cesiribacter andamanensis AMV16 TaxID=1279009 RepID=M7N329_9BACT|nr:DUF502 domain-containing protein [Cesiribacter andamanensis]EMR01692.1 hypothetical protein ADICEAN_03178 [Cesiribacter andamanensis AMV16]